LRLAVLSHFCRTAARLSNADGARAVWLPEDRVKIQ
jgi:hypothetical protein